MELVTSSYGKEGWKICWYNKALYGRAKKLETMTDNEWEELNMKAMSTIQLCLADELMYDVMDDVSTALVRLKLES